MASLKQKLGLVRGLLHSTYAYNSPYYVDVDVTNRCNLTCVGCQYHGPEAHENYQDCNRKDDLSVPLFEDLCTDLQAIGTKTLVLQGQGEPFLHPEIFDIIEIAKSHGLRTTLLSNGTLLNEVNTQKLIESKLDVLKVSLWAATPEQYEQNYPGNSAANYQKVVDGIARLSSLKKQLNAKHLSILIFYVFNKKNYKSIPDMVQFVRSLPCDGLYFSPMAVLKGDSGLERLSQNEQEEANRLLLDARKTLRENALKENVLWALRRQDWNVPVWTRMPCYIAWFHCRIKVDGTVEPCGRCDAKMGYGNLNQSRFRDIWNGDAVQAFRRRTATKEDLKQLSDQCRCHSCCFFWDMYQVHRVIKWIQPSRR
jgi:MoaA/NifB/PqqE/SkfB family radical SAM enzyme